jgi:hypothetical protein
VWNWRDVRERCVHLPKRHGQLQRRVREPGERPEPLRVVWHGVPDRCAVCKWRVRRLPERSGQLRRCVRQPVDRPEALWVLWDRMRNRRDVRERRMRLPDRQDDL